MTTIKKTTGLRLHKNSRKKGVRLGISHTNSQASRHFMKINKIHPRPNGCEKCGSLTCLGYCDNYNGDCGHEH